jgi:hypothetical protein
MRFDPRLKKMSPETRFEFAMADLGPDLPTVLFSSAFFPLTFEASDGDVFVRAATGEEVTDALTTEMVEEQGDDLDWPGDRARRLEMGLTWQERPDGGFEDDGAVQLWSGEVVLRSGQGVSGPFYVHQQAAEAWAFSTALGLPEGEVFECQVVPYRCARRFGPALLRDGEPEYERLRRFRKAPARA